MRRTPTQVEHDRVMLLKTLHRLGEASSKTLNECGHVRWIRGDVEALSKSGLISKDRDLGIDDGYYRRNVCRYCLTDKGRKFVESITE